jgi:hypothetical protein
MTAEKNLKEKGLEAKAQRKSPLDTNHATGVKAMREFLEREIWPQIPAHLRGKKIRKWEQESILGTESLRHNK